MPKEPENVLKLSVNNRKRKKDAKRKNDDDRRNRNVSRRYSPKRHDGRGVFNFVNTWTLSEILPTIAMARSTRIHHWINGYAGLRQSPNNLIRSLLLGRRLTCPCVSVTMPGIGCHLVSPDTATPVCR